RVLLVDQEGEQSLGGQAWWSFGGLFLVNSPEQRLMGIKDSLALAKQDWIGSASYDRTDEDYWGKKWAEQYINFATYEKRDWLREKGIRIFPVIGWAERGGYLAEGHGNSVPLFLIARGTGARTVEPVVHEREHYIIKELVSRLPRHQVYELILQGDVMKGMKGSILASTIVKRGEKGNRTITDEFS